MKNRLKEVYCENCKRSFVVNSDIYFCPECGTPLIEKGIVENKELPKQKTKPKKNRKLIKIALIIISVLIVGSGVAGGLYYKNGIDNANATAELIEYLPNKIYDYEHYDDLINDAYSAYLNLADWQKNKVSNKDKLLAIVPAYNEYKVGNLRTEMQKVTVDSVETTTVLSDTVNLYNALKPDQKSLLTGEEIHTLDNYVKVNNVIKGLNAINDDLVDRYNEVKDVQKIYYSIDPQFTNLVYNYGLVEEFDDKLAFLNLFAFEQNEAGTYSIKLKDPTSLSGKVEIPAKYDGQDVVSIPEGAFENCKNVTSFIVPGTITEIGKGAFKGCSRLEEISLPFTGNKIDSSSKEQVFGYIFGYTYTYSAYTVDAAAAGTYNPDYTFLNKIYNNCGYYDDLATWQYTYKNYDTGTKGYTSFYFYIPSSLKKVTITKQTEVKTAAFNGCTNIIEVNYVKGLTGLGEASFQNCKSLTTLNSEEVGVLNLIGDVFSIGSNAFLNCKGISKIIFPTESLSIENYAFSGCENVSELLLTNKIIKIGDYAFQGFKKIESLIIYNSTQIIGLGAFKGCNNLKEISLPFTGKTEDAISKEQVFGYIFGYTYTYSAYTVDAAAAGTYNPDYTFLNKIYNNCGYYDDLATWQYTYKNYDTGTKGYTSFYFYIPSSLKKVTITKQTEVKTAAFNGCNMLTSITFTQGIQKQGECAFQNCTAIINK